MGRRLDHATGGAGGANIATLATERDQEFVAAVGAVGAAEAMGQNAALQIPTISSLDMKWGGAGILKRPVAAGKIGLQILPHNAVQQSACWATRAIDT